MKKGRFFEFPPFLLHFKAYTISFRERVHLYPGQPEPLPVDLF
jgi:hypothetical protein